MRMGMSGVGPSGRGPNDRGPTDGRGWAAPLAQVRAYWEGLRCGSRPPERAAINPRGMEHALEHVFLLERIAPGIGRFRLAGMHLADLMGMEVRGMPLGSFFEPQARAALEGLFEAALTRPAVVDLWLEAERGIGRPALEGRMLLLPLLDDGICDKALGCLVTQGGLGRSPRRFAIARQQSEAVGERPARAAPHAAPSAAFAESPAPFRAAPVTAPVPPTPRAGGNHAGAARPRPHLRLVKSDD